MGIISFFIMTLIVGFQRAFSDAESVCVGVPQGSILGLPTVARKCSTLMYAEKSLSEDLDQIGSWLCNNSLFLNTVKNEAMLFGTHARLSDASFGIVLKGRPIERIYEFKYLRVVLE